MNNFMKQWLSSLILLPVAIFLIVNKGDFIFLLDHFTLLIHEGGHGIFRIFGKFIYTLGGSLMQILMALIFIFYFYINRQKIGIQISILYLAENLMNIGVYAADARAQRLPLLGGNKVYHDWNWLLRDMNMLQYDHLIGNIFYISGIVCCVFALIVPMFFKIYEKADIKLKL
jgi:hypothetical protein